MTMLRHALIGLVIAAAGCKSASETPVVVRTSFVARDLGPGTCFAVAENGSVAGYLAAAQDGLPVGPFLLVQDAGGSYTRHNVAKRAADDQLSILNLARFGRWVGFSNGPDHTEATTYDPAHEQWTTVAALGPGDRTNVIGLNADGWMVGVDRTFPDDGVPYGRPVLWTPAGAIRDLGPKLMPALGGTGVANAINGDRQIVGGVDMPDGQFHAYRYDDASGKVSDLGSLGGSYAEALDINDKGIIVGKSETAAQLFHGFVFDGTLQDLGTLGGDSSLALRVTNDGTVLGMSQTAEGALHPFVANQVSGHWQLTDIAPAQIDGRAVSTIQVSGISQRGQIAATAVYQDGPEDRCVLLSPN